MQFGDYRCLSTCARCVISMGRGLMVGQQDRRRARIRRSLDGVRGDAMRACCKIRDGAVWELFTCECDACRWWLGNPEGRRHLFACSERD
jgi:hypothetical protein